MATAIVGTLSAIAIPNYVNQLIRTNQNECSSAMSQLMTATMGFNDELSEYPSSWADLNSISAVMKDTGSAKNDNHFNPITLSNNKYTMSTTRNGSIFDFECTPKETKIEDYNVLGCLNLANGASEIKRGSQGAKAAEVNCD